MRRNDQAPLTQPGVYILPDGDAMVIARATPAKHRSRYAAPVKLPARFMLRILSRRGCEAEACECFAKPICDAPTGPALPGPAASRFYPLGKPFAQLQNWRMKNGHIGHGVAVILLNQDDTLSARSLPGRADNERPMENATHAPHRFRRPDLVDDFLRRLVEIQPATPGFQLAWIEHRIPKSSPLSRRASHWFCFESCRLSAFT